MKPSENMKAIREEINMSQERLGEILGVPRDTIANYEGDRARIPAEIFIKLIRLGRKYNVPFNLVNI